MDVLINELVNIAKAFNEKGLRPVICGGLGVYLLFEDSKSGMLRATNDIDLMLTKEQILEQRAGQLLAEIIEENKYEPLDEARYFQFKKDNDQKLDILSPMVEGFKRDNFRLKLVKSRLHSYMTEEAEFIGEGLREVKISDEAIISVPSPTNLLIMKLHAFRDRFEKKDEERATAHVWDVFVIMVLSGREDFLEGQVFLEKHKDSDIINNASKIVDDYFRDVNGGGWLTLLGANEFFSNENISQKRQRVDLAMKRLIKWFK
jgi:hypothetical protein